MIIYLKKNNKNVSECLIRISKIITVILFFIAIHDILFTPFFQKSGYRYFMDSLNLMFPVPTYLATASVILIILLGYTNENKKNTKYMLMISFVGIMTLRSKAIGFFVVYWFFYLMIFVIKTKNYFLIFVITGLL